MNYFIGTRQAARWRSTNPRPLRPQELIHDDYFCDESSLVRDVGIDQVDHFAGLICDESALGCVHDIGIDHWQVDHFAVGRLLRGFVDELDKLAAMLGLATGMLVVVMG